MGAFDDVILGLFGAAASFLFFAIGCLYANSVADREIRRLKRAINDEANFIAAGGIRKGWTLERYIAGDYDDMDRHEEASG
jgi:hypothetical protein